MSYNPNNPNGQGTMANSSPIVIASDQTKIPVAGDVASGTADSGNPIKIGYQSELGFAGPVTNGQRVNGIADKYGRQLIVSHDVFSSIWKSAEYTTAQTGTNIWVPVTNNRFVITSLHITTGGSTSGLVTIWGAQTATVNYVAGTDQVFFRGNFAPSTAGYPGVIIQPFSPLYSDTVNDCLKITTSAGMTVYVQVYGYEIQ